ncbi:MAG: PaaI family thioesterase [Candidatus Aminicenantes bacterium]|nr:PaaI family thioesterase [Candidatus Aminicenantes bacterium]
MAQIALTDDRFCFVCGEDNPDGLRLNFEYPEPGRCRAVYIPDRRFQGWKDILHGGIISTLLDEAFAHAYGGRDRGAGEAAVTAEMTVRFIKPVKIGHPVVLEGRVLSNSRRVIMCESTLADDSGQIQASASGKLIKPKKILAGNEM